MDTQISRRLLNGLGATAYGQLVTAVIQIVGVPILLYYWGTQLYGEWLILFAIPSFLTMTDLGFSQSAANDMTARVARGDKRGALAVFQSLTALVYSFVFLGLVLSGLLVMLLPLGNWIHFGLLPAMDVRKIIWLFAAEVLIKLADGPNHAGFRASGEYALHRAINSSAILMQFGGVWVLAIAGLGPLAAAAWFASVRLVFTPAVAVLLFQRHRFLHPGFTYARFSELKALVRPASANIAQPLAMALNIQGMVLVVGAVLGPVAVVTFTVLRTLTRVALQAIWSVSHAFEPELASAWGKGDMLLLKKLFEHALRVGFWLGVLATVSLYFLGDYILLHWTQGKVAMNLALFDWLLLSAFSSVLWYGGLHLLKAANCHLRATLWYVLVSLLAVGLAYLLLRITGRLAAAGLALLLTDVLMTAYTLPQSMRFAGLRLPALIVSLFDFKPYWKQLTAKGRHAP